MVAAVLSAPRAWRRMTELPTVDRSWLVAGLTLAGMTAHETMERLDCSLRLVRSTRAEAGTQIAMWAQDRIGALCQELQAEWAAHQACRLELRRARDEIARLRRQLDHVVAKLPAKEEVRKCARGHAVVGENVYRSGGRELCRTCNRENVIRHRNRKRAELQCNFVGVSSSG